MKVIVFFSDLKFFLADCICKTETLLGLEIINLKILEIEDEKKRLVVTSSFAPLHCPPHLRWKDSHQGVLACVPILPSLEGEIPARHIESGEKRDAWVKITQDGTLFASLGGEVWNAVKRDEHGMCLVFPWEEDDSDDDDLPLGDDYYVLEL